MVLKVTALSLSLFVGGLVLSASGNAQQAEVVPAAPPTKAATANTPAETPIRWTGEGYRLAWSDDFSGKSLDTERWGFRTDSRHWSTQKPENVSIRDGMLYLAVRKEKAGTMEYTGSGIISKRTFRYGYYESRLKTPPGAGWHTSFWMILHSSSTKPGSNDPVHELDVIENDSVNQNRYSVNTHRWKPGPHKWLGGARVTTPNLSTDFHTFGCEFTPTEVRYFFDGVLVHTFDATKFPHGEQNIWLTTIASHLGGTKAVDDTQLPSAAIYDYVRFFERVTP